MRPEKFLSADQLNVTELVRSALIITLDRLESGSIEYAHVDASQIDWETEPPKAHLEFNMSVWRRNHDCGTVVCMGGLAEVIAGVEPGMFEVIAPPQLEMLYYPPVQRAEDITVKEAAAALRNWLETGAARWHSVINNQDRMIWRDY